MTREEIITALRLCADGLCADGLCTACPYREIEYCGIQLKRAAADLLEAEPVATLESAEEPNLRAERAEGERDAWRAAYDRLANVLAAGAIR